MSFAAGCGAGAGQVEQAESLFHAAGAVLVDPDEPTTYEWKACNSTLAFAVDNLTLESGGAHSVKITKVEDYGTIKVITETQEKNGVSGVYKKSWAAPGGKPIPASAVYRKKTQ